MPYKDPIKQREAQAAYARKFNKERNADRRKVRREMVDGHKSGIGCFMCGERDPVCLDLHHIEPSTKVKNVSRMCHSMAKLSDIQDEMDKCMVVCANCHRKIHRDRA